MFKSILSTRVPLRALYTARGCEYHQVLRDTDVQSTAANRPFFKAFKSSIYFIFFDTLGKLGLRRTFKGPSQYGKPSPQFQRFQEERCHSNHTSISNNSEGTFAIDCIFKETWLFNRGLLFAPS
jgi:hypothetical protein